MNERTDAASEHEPTEFRSTLTLIQRAKEGNDDAFARLCERYEVRLLARIRKMIGPEVRGFAQSMDIVQELFVDLLRGFDGVEIRDDKAFLRWATGIARNNIRDLVRRHRVRRMEMLATSLAGAAARSGDPGAAPLEEAERRDQIRVLNDALARLPEDYRSVIELRDIAGLAFAEIAKKMGRPSEAAAQMLHARALTRLSGMVRPKVH